MPAGQTVNAKALREWPPRKGRLRWRGARCHCQRPGRWQAARLASTCAANALQQVHRSIVAPATELRNGRTRARETHAAGGERDASRAGRRPQTRRGMRWSAAVATAYWHCIPCRLFHPLPFGCVSSPQPISAGKYQIILYYDASSSRCLGARHARAAAGLQRRAHGGEGAGCEAASRPEDGGEGSRVGDG